MAKNILVPRPLNEEELIPGEITRKMFLPFLLTYLNTSLKVPEDKILKQGQKDIRNMYFIIKGDCVILMRDHKGRENLRNEELKLLVGGNHFGEISMLYDCPRQVDVISRSYITLATLHYHRYQKIISEYPNF